MTERDFAIKAPRHLHAGEVQLTVRNKGPDAHELILVRSDDPLPLRGDGSTVDEETLKRATVGMLEAGEPGGSRRLRVHLAPGRYELFCNMAGHYQGGMHARLVVQ